LGTPLPKCNGKERKDCCVSKCKKQYINGFTSCPCDEEENTLAQTIEKTPELSLLNVAINVANLSDTIQEGEYTIFAPNDDAFKSIGDEKLESLLEDESQLAEILKLHIVSGKIESSDIPAGETNIKTLNGENINIVNNSGISINSQNGSGGKVVSPDIKASNGVIHIIDGVLLPNNTESIGGGNRKKVNTQINSFDSSVYNNTNY
jgi:uncharacterized surface protein with fasciclin (FAS1) repeats